MWFNVIFILFVFASTGLNGSYILGSTVTVRQIMGIIMLVACFIERPYVYSDKYLKLYIVFLLFYGFSCLLWGNIDDYIHELIGRYVFCIIAFWSTYLYIKRGSSIMPIIVTLIIVALFDGLLISFRFFGLSNIYDFISQALGLKSMQELYVLKAEHMMNENGTTSGAQMSGLLGNPVQSGYYSIVAIVLSMILLKKHIKLTVLVLIVLLIFSYMIQQRSASVIALIAMSFIMLNLKRHNYLKFFFVICFVIITFYIFSADWNLGRFSDFDLKEARGAINSNSENFISQYPILGGIFEYREKYIISPHNLFYNALIYGGLLGAIPIFIILSLQIKTIIKDYLKNVIIIRTIVGFALFGYIINGFFHNASIVTGDILGWFLWSVYYFSLQKDNLLNKNNDIS